MADKACQRTARNNAGSLQGQFSRTTEPAHIKPQYKNQYFTYRLLAVSVRYEGRATPPSESSARG